MTDNGWPEYANLVLNELKRHEAWLGNLDKKMDNHITHLEHRITKIETDLKNQFKLEMVLLSAILGIFGMVFVLLVT